MTIILIARSIDPACGEWLFDCQKHAPARHGWLGRHLGHGAQTPTARGRVFRCRPRHPLGGQRKRQRALSELGNLLARGTEQRHRRTWILPYPTRFARWQSVDSRRDRCFDPPRLVQPLELPGMMRMRVLRERRSGSQSGQGGEDCAACGHFTVLYINSPRVEQACCCAHRRIF